MFKHNASSIKETSNKMFVSLEEKTKWNSKANKVHEHDNKHYTKSETDILLENVLDVSEGSQISVDVPLDTFIKDIEIFGNTKQFRKITKVSPTLEAGGIEYVNGTDAVIYDGEGNIATRYRTVEYIPVSVGDTIFIAKKSDSNTALYANYRFYDENKQYIKLREGDVQYNRVYTIPFTEAKYMRFYAGGEMADGVDVTITHRELDDFRSIGEEEEDGTYSLNIISSGKNLLNTNMITGYYNIYDGLHRESTSNVCTASPVKLSKGTYTIDILESYSHWVLIYDEFDNYQTNRYVGTRKAGNFEMPIDGYIRFYNVQVDSNVALNYNYGIYKYDGGSEIPEYEPYTQESVKIHLPTQLEKVGQVADRLFVNEKGIMCIEKWIETKKYLNPGSGNLYGVAGSPELTNTYLFGIKGTFIVESEHKDILCSKLIWHAKENMGNVWHYDQEGITYDGFSYIFRFSKDILTIGADVIDDVRRLINTYVFKCVAVKPTIIEIGKVSDILLKLKKGNRIITTDSQLHHSMKCTTPTSLSTCIDTQTENVLSIKNRFDMMNKVIQPNTKVNVNDSSGYITIPESKAGYTADMVVKGDTYISAIDPRLFTDVNNFNTLGNPNYITFSNDGLITINQPADFKSNMRIYPKVNMYNLKPNTVYTLVVSVYENTFKTTDSTISNTTAIIFGNTDNILADENIHRKTLFKKNSRFSIRFGEHGVFKTLFTTREDIDTLDPLAMADRIYTPSTVQGTLKFRYTLIEGDHTNNDAINDAFIGVKSSVPSNKLVMTSINENLFTYTPHNRGNASWEVYDNKITIYSTGSGYYYKHFITNTKPNTEYELTIDKVDIVGGDARAALTVYNGDHYRVIGIITSPIENGNGYKTRFKTPDCIGKNNTSVNLCLYSLSDENKYVEMATTTYHNIQIKEVVDGVVNESSVRNVNHELSLELSEPLRSSSATNYDSIEKIGNSYYVVRRCAEVTLDGSDDEVYREWTYNTGEGFANNTYNVFINTGNFDIPMTNKIDNVSPIKSSTIPYDHNSFINRVRRSTTMSNSCIHIAIEKSELESLDPTGVKKWIAKNPITVVYERLNYQYELLHDVDLNLRTHGGRMYIKTNTYDSIMPTLNFNLPCNISDSLRTIQNKLYAIEQRNEMELKTLLDTSYQTDTTSYKFEVVANNTRNACKDIDEDLYYIFKTIIESRNYNREDIENKIDFYTIISKLSFDMADELFMLIEDQYTGM